MDKKTFQKLILDFYKKEGRHSLPWRHTRDVYAILVSEVMLQQTQVSRVLEKYALWMEAFPNVETLSKASLSEVLFLWQGLGYSRRARFLHLSSKQLFEKYGNKIPPSISVEELDELPGVGPYTARAVKTFTSGGREIFIETNIRTIFLHHFFNEQKDVLDSDLLDKIEEMLPTNKFREWYYALMDYGAFLKKSGVRNNSRSAQYIKQTKFQGSGRELRARCLREILIEPKGKTLGKIVSAIGNSTTEAVLGKLEELIKDGLINKKRNKYFITH